jgi:hypothetical protein
MTRRALILVLIAACGKASSDGEAKQWSGDQPPKEVEIPANLSIAVMVDGVAKPALTAEVLKGKKPDFADSDHEAWLVPTLVAEAAPPGSVVEAFGPNGVSVSFAHPTTDGLEPVVFLTRRGDAIFSAVDPKDPFPGFHGRGGRLHRPGDSMPRVNSITRLEITHPKP